MGHEDHVTCLEVVSGRGYATVDDGVNYRDIAETMTLLGFEMNHSSARNYVLRVMRKFVEAFAEEWNVQLGDVDIDEIAKSPEFQAGVGDILHALWAGHENDDIFSTDGQSDD
jgi:hypothetical protein